MPKSNAPAVFRTRGARPVLIAFVALLATAVTGGVARGQETGGAEPAAPAGPAGGDAGDAGTTAPRDWQYPTRGPDRPAGESPGRQWWETGPWHITPSVGGAWFDGDGLSDSPAFVARVALERELTNDAYLLGSYLLAFPVTDGDELDPGGDGDDETHDLHAFSLGVGVSAEVLPDFRLFFEPQGGIVLGSDIDPAGVFQLSGGIELTVTDYVAIRFAVTAFLTDVEIDTGGADANLESGVIGSVGVSFEF